ncbi:hypothetical protein HN873_058657 [Arachis hypogaea]
MRPKTKNFDDSGMPLVPTRWRKQCELTSNFDPSLYNRKLIGAGIFSKGYLLSSDGSYMVREKDQGSPHDHEGHGGFEEGCFEEREEHILKMMMMVNSLLKDKIKKKCC